MAENETQETTEEVTETVETQTPVTEKAIEVAPAATTEETAEAKTEETAEAKTEETAEAKTEETAEEVTEEVIEEEEEEISYHAVEKEGEITAIWEMQGPKHIRTISPRSSEGEKILNLFTSEIHETDAPPMAASGE
jgi:23S rRNA G2069 N7-methylase RlmK/C1962 C5-methylase RlmI